MFPAVLKPWPFRNGQIIYLAVLKPSSVLKRPGQFKTWFQNGQINNLAVLKPHLISKFFCHKEAMINIKCSIVLNYEIEIIEIVDSKSLDVYLYM